MSARLRLGGHFSFPAASLFDLTNPILRRRNKL